MKPASKRDARILRADQRFARQRDCQPVVAELGIEGEVGVRVDQSGQDGLARQVDDRGVGVRGAARVGPTLTILPSSMTIAWLVSVLPVRTSNRCPARTMVRVGAGAACCAEGSDGKQTASSERTEEFREFQSSVRLPCCEIVFRTATFAAQGSSRSGPRSGETGGCARLFRRCRASCADTASTGIACPH